MEYIMSVSFGSPNRNKGKQYRTVRVLAADHYETSKPSPSFPSTGAKSFDPLRWIQGQPFSTYDLLFPSSHLHAMVVDPCKVGKRFRRPNHRRFDAIATLRPPTKSTSSSEPQFLVKIVTLPVDPEGTVLGVLLLGIDGAEVCHWPHEDCTTRQQVIDAISADAKEGDFRFQVLD